ncbi:MAG TPA: PhzF family phenazine biosynthesis protein [Ktedonobacteraceae bacterium]|nr:PhzF family phenazine biosynthesis protein [Ktedonobacteraceae bacterium]
MGLTIYQVDAFTDRPFAGNPAAVCLLPSPRDDRWMQQVAQEMNLSETAFLLWQKDGFKLRWFTPLAEVDLCGHATLASAHILWEQEYLQPGEQARFNTRSGLLTADRQQDLIELDFPATLEEQTDAPPHLLEALGVTASYIGKNVFDYLVEVDSEETVRVMQPNITLLVQTEARGVIVTSRASSPGYDFVSRFFAPRVGVNEDPVTGSAHCCLAPYWGKKLNKNEMVAFQASARGGMLYLRINGDRVKLAGHAVTVMHGELAE